MISALIGIPLSGGLACFIIRSDRLRRTLLIGCAILHALLSALSWIWAPGGVGGWLGLDALGLLTLSVTSLLFLCAAFYGVGYLRREQHGQIKDLEEDVFFVNEPEAIFTGCLLLFLTTMTCVAVSRHFGLLWVAVEATTLSSAPLIYFHRHHRSLEAAWKYLLICSVGIALALLGNFCLGLAASARGETIPLILENLLPKARALQIPWLRAAFLLLLVGYGTKMGLAPLHTWLPDAHSESPSVVSALLSGALLNCAFLGILRGYQVCVAAGQAAFAQDLLRGFGLVSMAVAAIFIFSQRDFKRLLAYSSVEHMGILSLGIGLGGEGVFGAMFHTLNHSLTKGMLFLVAGNLVGAYKTKSVREVQGACILLPVSGVLWVVGFLAITGTPPFAPFLSELIILKAALETGHGGIAVAYLAFLALIFIGMSGTVLRMAQGEPPLALANAAPKEPLESILPPLALAVLILFLGLHLPAAVKGALSRAAQDLGASPWP